MTDHANDLREALDYCWLGGPDHAFVRKHADRGKVALDALLAGHAAEVEQLRQEIHGLVDGNSWMRLDEARADAETLRQGIRSAMLCVENLGLAVAVFAPHGFDSRRTAEYDLAARLRAEIDAIRAALAAAQEPPASFTPDIPHGKPGGKQEPPAEPCRWPACQDPAVGCHKPTCGGPADQFAGLADVYARVLPVVAEFVQEHGRLPVDLAEATNGPQEPPARPPLCFAPDSGSRSAEPVFCLNRRGQDGPHSWEPPAKGDAEAREAVASLHAIMGRTVGCGCRTCKPPASFTPGITHGKPGGEAAQEPPVDPRDKRFLPRTQEARERAEQTIAQYDRYRSRSDLPRPNPQWVDDVLFLADLVSTLETALWSIIVRCEEGSRNVDWLPTIATIARTALAQEDTPTTHPLPSNP